jgi:quercetin dioxygenase-like cupin family protein
MEKIINPIAQEEIIFHATAKSTNGGKTLMEVTLGPKGGNPLHYHRQFAERFTILDGELNVQVGETVHKLKKGETITAKIGDRHRFFNTSGKQVKFNCELLPAHEGFENVLRIGFGLANDGYAGSNGMPKSLIHNGVLMNLGDGYFVGVFSLFEKLFRLIGRTKKAKQVEKELIEKYCMRN